MHAVCTKPWGSLQKPWLPCARYVTHIRYIAMCHMPCFVCLAQQQTASKQMAIRDNAEGGMAV